MITIKVQLPKKKKLNWFSPKKILLLSTDESIIIIIL